MCVGGGGGGGGGGVGTQHYYSCRQIAYLIIGTCITQHAMGDMIVHCVLIFESLN